jgi:hypothetical protein
MSDELNIDRLKELVKANKEDDNLQRLYVIKDTTAKILQNARFGINVTVVEAMNNSEINYFKEKGLIVEHTGFRIGKKFHRFHAYIIIPE